MSQKEVLIDHIADAMRMEFLALPGGTMSISDIDTRLAALEKEFQDIFQKSRTEEGGYMKYADEFKEINDEAARLKEKRSALLAQQQDDSAANRKIADAIHVLNGGSSEITEWDESMIRQIVDTIKVISEDRILVCLRGGMEIEEILDKERE
jgi:hypothetical protein